MHKPPSCSNTTTMQQETKKILSKINPSSNPTTMNQCYYKIILRYPNITFYFYGTFTPMLFPRLFPHFYYMFRALVAFFASQKRMCSINWFSYGSMSSAHNLDPLIFWGAFANTNPSLLHIMLSVPLFMPCRRKHLMLTMS